MRISKVFKQQQLQNIFTLSPKELEIESVLYIKADVQISKYVMDNSVTGKSYEGQILSQNKLEVEGYVQYKMEYISINQAEGVLSTQFLLPFKFPIVLGDACNKRYDYKVSSDIEDIYIRQVGERQLYISTMLSLSVC